MKGKIQSLKEMRGTTQRKTEKKSRLKGNKIEKERKLS
jgi:hypothetical protein